MELELEILWLRAKRAEGLLDDLVIACNGLIDALAGSDILAHFPDLEDDFEKFGRVFKVCKDK